MYTRTHTGPRAGSRSRGASTFRGGRPQRHTAHPSHGGRRFGAPRGGARRQRGEHIDISRFIHTPLETIHTETKETARPFSQLDLSRPMLDLLAKEGYENAMPIQFEAIPYILDGRDLIGKANTGTGKTAAFLIPLIEKITKEPREHALILAPTRELAMQIESEFKKFSAGRHMYAAVCVGGMPIGRQLADLRRAPAFVIGTVGRIKDLTERGSLPLSAFSYVVLDEVDQMLDMGFVDDIKRIMAAVPPKRQTLFFSATMPPKIRELTKSFLTDPIAVEIAAPHRTVNIKQDIVRVSDHTKKFEELERLLGRKELEKVLIFSETKRDVERLAKELVRKGFTAESIHGDKRQRERTHSLTLFRDGKVKILVATDVAARGLDIKDISHVINYTIPQTHDDYVHRIGRTGRAGKGGAAITFVE
ncbi:MAG: DEAD/DEAH box helicase [Patescibacteria group bacterium]